MSVQEWREKKKAANTYKRYGPGHSPVDLNASKWVMPEFDCWLGAGFSS